MTDESALDPGARTSIGKQVKRARLRHRWGKEEAARRAGISSITWKRVEDGESVRDLSLRAVMAAVGIQAEGQLEDEVTDLAALLARDPTLSAASRSHIVNQYRLLQRLSAMEIQPAGSLDPDERAILDSDLTQAQKEEALVTLRENPGRGGPPKGAPSPTVRKRRAQ